MCAKAINTLEITIRENKIFTIDAVNFLKAAERIVGVGSITLSKANGPTVSDIGYGSDGKYVAFRLDATGSGVVATTYTITILVAVMLEDELQTKEFAADLIVCP